MSNVKKVLSITLCSLVIFGLGACSKTSDDSSAVKPAASSPSQSNDATAPASQDSATTGPDPNAPHLIPRPFVNADGTVNPPVEPDLTDHSDQGVRETIEFFMQVSMYYAQTQDAEFLKRYFDPESVSIRELLDDWDAVRAWAEGGNIYYMEDITIDVATAEDREENGGYPGGDGTALVFYEIDQKYRPIGFSMALDVNPETNKFWVYEMGIGSED